MARRGGWIISITVNNVSQVAEPRQAASAMAEQNSFGRNDANWVAPGRN